MFTGLIEELGTMKRIMKKGNTLVLVIAAEKIMTDFMKVTVLLLMVFV